MVLSTVVLGVVVCSLVGFACAVFEFPFRRTLSALVLLNFMRPFEPIVVPLYVPVRTLRWSNTRWALVLPEVASGPVLLLFRRFFAGIPKELSEAARVDGASRLAIRAKPTPPLAGPLVAAASLVLFLHRGDAFFRPLVAAASAALVTFQVAVVGNVTLEVPKWGGLFASASTTIPLAVIPCLLRQRSDVRACASDRAGRPIGPGSDPDRDACTEDFGQRRHRGRPAAVPGEAEAVQPFAIEGPKPSPSPGLRPLGPSELCQDRRGAEGRAFVGPSGASHGSPPRRASCAGTNLLHIVAPRAAIFALANGPPSGNGNDRPVGSVGEPGALPWTRNTGGRNVSLFFSCSVRS